jgi:hypothetical protein
MLTEVFAAIGFAFVSALVITVFRVLLSKD